MTKVSILLDAHVRDLMKSTARKEQTYSDFILELIEHKTTCPRNNTKKATSYQQKEINSKQPRGSVFGDVSSALAQGQ